MGRRRTITKSDVERFHQRNAAKIKGALSRAVYPLTAPGIMEEARVPIQYLHKTLTDLLKRKEIVEAGKILGYETYRIRKT
jgi:hypothetical protein